MLDMKRVGKHDGVYQDVKGGVLTPATAFGSLLADRLRADDILITFQQ